MPTVMTRGGRAAAAGNSPGSNRGRPRRLRGRILWGLWSGAALVVAAVLVVTVFTHFTSGARAATAVASLPYWSFSDGTDTVLSHRQDFSEVSPWIYGLSGGGQIEIQYPPSQPRVMADIGRLRAAGLRVVPTIANVSGGKWAYQPVARMLHDPALMNAHIAAIVTLVDHENYAGIDIDYEGLHAGDRQAFSTFITQLGAALHAHGKILSVAVFAKTTDAGYGEQNVAQDYAVIGRGADQVKVMAYDYHWNTSPAGPIAPVGWIRSVLGYARTQIPPSKIILGVPLYGYDWVGDRGTDLTWQQAEQLAAAHHVTVQYDLASQAPWFSYTDSSGRQHQVWFENPESSAAKFAIAKDTGIGGTFLWMYGNEAPATWPQLHHYLPLGSQPTTGPTGRP